VETDGSDTGVGSPCFIGKLLVPGYKDTVFLAAVQGDFGALMYKMKFYRQRPSVYSLNIFQWIVLMGSTFEETGPWLFQRLSK
jgi:hypothetical protein